MSFKNNKVHCDKCGRLSKNSFGEYIRDKKTNSVGYINSKGNKCEHDYCDDCYKDLNKCPKCSQYEPTHWCVQCEHAWQGRDNRCPGCKRKTT